MHLIALDELGQSDEALVEFLEAVRCGRSDASAHLNLGTAFYRRGRYALALESCSRARDLAPDDPDVRARLGAVLTHMGASSAALEHLRVASAGRPHDATIWAYLARVHIELDDLDRACDAFRRAVECDPNDVRTRRQLGMLLLGAAAVAEAREQLAAACALSPNDAQARYYLGMALGQLDRADEACEQLRQATRLAPRHVDYWVELALVEGRAGRYADAARAFDAAAELDRCYVGKRPELRDVIIETRRMAAASAMTTIRGPLGFGCQLCRALPRSESKLLFEHKRELYRRSHEEYSLVMCRECRQTYLHRWVEVIDWSGTHGDDWWRHWVPLLGSEVAEIDAAFPAETTCREHLPLLDRLIHARCRLTQYPDGGFAWSDTAYTADDLVMPG